MRAYRTHALPGRAAGLLATFAAAMAMSLVPVQPVMANGQILIGHWRNTVVVFEDPRDTNLVLRADGVAQTWEASAAGRSAVSTGTWRVSGNTIFLRFPGEEEGSAPVYIHEGRLVLPNIPNERRFWDRVGN